MYDHGIYENSARETGITVSSMGTSSGNANGLDNPMELLDRNSSPYSFDDYD